MAGTTASPETFRDRALLILTELEKLGLVKSVKALQKEFNAKHPKVEPISVDEATKVSSVEIQFVPKKVTPSNSTPTSSDSESDSSSSDSDGSSSDESGDEEPVKRSKKEQAEAKSGESSDSSSEEGDDSDSSDSSDDDSDSDDGGKKEATSNTRIKVVGNYFLFKRPGRNPVKVKDQKQARLDIKNKRRAVHGLPAKLSYRDI